MRITRSQSGPETTSTADHSAATNKQGAEGHALNNVIEVKSIPPKEEIKEEVAAYIKIGAISKSQEP